MFKALTTTALMIISAVLAAMFLAAGCGGGSGAALGPAPQAQQSPQPDATLITAGWGATTGFNVGGGAGSVEPGALVVLLDDAANTTSAIAGPDGSFVLVPDALTFNLAPGTQLTMTQTADGMTQSAPITIVVPPM
ncbi:hypothetical protein JW859_04885 [bacterium]|nr:hypothetical protein [bacterium]